MERYLNVVLVCTLCMAHKDNLLVCSDSNNEVHCSPCRWWCAQFAHTPNQAGHGKQCQSVAWNWNGGWWTAFQAYGTKNQRGYWPSSSLWVLGAAQHLWWRHECTLVSIAVQFVGGIFFPMVGWWTNCTNTNFALNTSQMWWFQLFLLGQQLAGDVWWTLGHHRSQHPTGHPTNALDMGRMPHNFPIWYLANAWAMIEKSAQKNQFKFIFSVGTTAN